MKHSNNIRTFIGVLLLILFISIPFTAPFKEYLSIPNEIITMNGKSPITVPSLGKAIEINSSLKRTNGYDKSEFYAEESGMNELVYKAAGFPIKKVDVSIVDNIKVIPGGQSIGVQLHTLGVLVVGHHLVNGQDEMLSPGEKAEVVVGDVILKINGNSIKKMEEVKPLVEKAGKNKEVLNLTVKRGNKTIETSLEPAMDYKESEYRIGLYIRDSAAGIGTMSFYDPESKRYGALGHVISDMDTKKPIEIHNGTIVRSSVTSIEKGNNGIPGEKQATFSIKENKIGTITKNSPFGIFGKLNELMENDHAFQPMSIGLAHEVEEGPAKILTVIEGEKVEEFDVEIISSVPQKFPATKGMVIQIKDPKLLKHTGGIVQGMSGSPIIQNGKIIGAITHVFVNDPTSGYGVHIEWMLQEAGINLYKETATAS